MFYTHAIPSEPDLRVALFFFLCFRNLASSLISSGSELSDLVNGYMDKPCNTFCKGSFTKSRACIHGFKFCVVCNEVWCQTIYPICPRHACAAKGVHLLRRNDSPSHMRHHTDIKIRRALTASQPYTYHDTQCDDVCSYAFDKLGYQTCRHNMTKCPSCHRIWANRIECNCFLEFLDESSSSSDDSYMDSSSDDDDISSEPAAKVLKTD